MRPKIPAAITKIVLNTPTFHNAVINPSMINFFYGKNGTGKSTIAQAIKDKAGTEWGSGKTADDYTILLYNQEFINNNIRSYGSMPGVFTISEDNADVKEKIDAERERQRSSEAQQREFTEIKKKKETELQTVESAFQTSCWNIPKAVRDRFPEALKGSGALRSKEKFAEELLKVEQPAECDEEVLKKKYDTAFDNTSTAYPLMNQVTGVSIPTSDLLAQSITSSSETDFSQFMKALKATDWVRQGHEQFHSTPDGKCPYCQQRLPVTFEEDFAQCFDAQYQQSVNALTAFKASYYDVVGAIWKQYDKNLSNVYPKLDITEYKALMGQLESTIKMNLSLLSDKIKEPSTVIVLEDLGGIINRLNSTIAEFNAQIQENNNVVNAKLDTQKECKDIIWAHMAFLLEGEIAKYKESKKVLEREIWSAGCKADAGRDGARHSREEIKRLNLQYSNTQAAADSINLLLRNSGFQGFRIQEKDGVPNAYEVVRDNNEPARNMSEGEKNFIAFLYFYHLVRGSDNADETGKKKIVVIDDPVSSMDSSVMFVVAALVREMIEVCYNTASYRDQRITGAYIEQIFIMTHNAFFHKEISYNQVRRYEWVTFFKVEKIDSHSSCIPCIRDVGIDEKENYNPVQNSYAALWTEYKEVKTPIPLMNVIHRILDYYFLQMCGYDGMDIRSRILSVKENRDKFIVFYEDGQPDDYTKYHLASAMLQYLSNGCSHISDGLDFVDDCVDVEQCRDTFEMIFDTLGQIQHFNMMMEKKI